MTAEQITRFLLAIAALLGSARLLGEIARRFRQPPILGEILAGLLLGPTVFGHIAPGVQAWLFPVEGEIAISLEGLTTLAVTLFLLVAGLEVDLSIAFRQGRTALGVAGSGTVVPFALGFATAWFAPWLYGGVDAGRELELALFIATALSISALPVIAKILKDLNLLKSDIGVIVVASATLNDLIGWLVFAVVLGMMGTGKAPLPLPMVLLATVGFVVAMLTLGRWVVHRTIPFVQAHTSWPAGVLTYAVTGALLAAAFTEWLGIHAIFGAFLFGVALGDTRHLRERTRHTLDEFISFIFAPLFFASIGLKVDFLAHFDLLSCVVVLLLATVGKVAGCYWGGRWGGLQKREALAVGAAMNARGAMEIILGLLALNYGLISEALFVSLVVMALVTSMASGGTTQRFLQQRTQHPLEERLSPKLFVRRIRANERQAAIGELSTTAATAAGIPEGHIAAAVWTREEILPTGIEHGVAIPHARLKALTKPVVVLGLSADGIDFDAPDGKPAKVIFMILTPAQDSGAQLEILASIGRACRSQAVVDTIASSESFTEVLAALRSQQAT